MDKRDDYVSRADVRRSVLREAPNLAYAVDRVSVADVVEKSVVKDAANDAIRILDAINSSGRLDYGDYCDLHSALCAIS